MVRLPDEFIATKARGYFFNTENEILYSVKVGGELRPLRLIQPCYFNRLRRPAFYVSVNNIKKCYGLDKLQELAEKAKNNPQDEVFPVQGQKVTV